MHIRMLKTAAGSEDRVSTRVFESGQVYDLSLTADAQALAKVFVHEKLAEVVGQEKVVELEVDASAPPENKMIPVVPRNKNRSK